MHCSFALSPCFGIEDCGLVVGLCAGFEGTLCSVGLSIYVEQCGLVVDLGSAFELSVCFI